MKTLRLLLWTILGCSLATPAWSVEPVPLFLSVPVWQKGSTTQAAQPPLPGAVAVTLNTRTLKSDLGEGLVMAIPDGESYDLIVEQRQAHGNGDLTLVGRVAGSEAGGRFVITVGEGSAFGRIHTPDGLFRLTSNPQGCWLINQTDSPLSPAPHPEPDFQVIEEGERPRSKTAPEPATPRADGDVEIDLMILYTPAMAARYPGDALETRLNYLISLSNQAYTDSEINITLRLVHFAEVDYSESTYITTAHSDLMAGTDAAFSDMASLRTTYGADLISLMRPYRYADHVSCGYAGYSYSWIGSPDNYTFSADSGYSVVSDGDDILGSLYYCGEYTLPHELGHNLGSTHDVANTSSSGFFDYSYGYGISGTFGTVMSYLSPVEGKYSNPDILCADGAYACGVEDSADNARSMNNLAGQIAAFMPTVVTANTAPAASDGTLTTDEDTAATGTLIASDADSDSLTYSIVSQGNLGTAAITDDSSGAFTYTPNTDASGSDSFTFKVNDGTEDSNTATVTVTITPLTFDDVASDHWAGSYITTLASNAITSGCTSDTYCPDNTLQRAEMAIFLLRSQYGSSYSPTAATGTAFDDISSSYWAGNFVENLAELGITNGCDDSNFCPNREITRSEMAIFLLRTKYGSDYQPPTATGSAFGDISSDYWAAGFIEQLNSEGFSDDTIDPSKSCDSGNYCPSLTINRAEMAVFLVKTFGME
ncbi:MAG: S-layer homology domain-containing protein [Magnetococcales bacterium]|nr:S-layer homology domain-containing protein [Magnetococcales bacterium]